MLVFTGITANYLRDEIRIDRRSLPEKIVSTVVAVESSTGVVIYSDDKRALVLTAFHVIDTAYDKAACSACDYGIDVVDKRAKWQKGRLEENSVKYPVTYIEVNRIHDLAIIEIEVPHKIDAAKVNSIVKLGEDIYVAANPKREYKTITKGIVSSKLRTTWGSPNIQVDAGIIFGSSGGGIFNMDGEFIAVVKAVKMMDTGHCFDVWDVDGNWMDMECVEIPLPFMGYATHPAVVRTFLLQGVFGERFDYLK